MVHTVYDNVRLAVSLYRPSHLCHLPLMTLIRRLQVQTLMQNARLVLMAHGYNEGE